jgi:hypothetical protein
MNRPAGDMEISSFGKTSLLNTRGIVSVRMLGSNLPMDWHQENQALIIRKPA